MCLPDRPCRDLKDTYRSEGFFGREFFTTGEVGATNVGGLVFVGEIRFQ